MKVLDQVFVLKNGVKLPKIGLGTWQVKDGDEAYNSVRYALKHGYRHIDTAEGYRNEESVGRAVRDSGIPREEIFVTSKLESHIKTYEGAKQAFENTLKALEFEYLDLFLIHAPWPWSEIGKDCREGNVQAWKAMEELYRAGKIRAIGVSNFDPNDIENILKHCEIIPHVNQIGYFIGLDQKKTLEYCETKGIVVEAYSPLGIGYLLSNPIIDEVAQKYAVSPAQICIRYCIQKNTAPLPKSTHEARIIQNTQVDFEIKPEDMAILDEIKGDPRRWS
ncbi:aldo/keto reductase [Paracholeplasma manati]|uniref:Aldo/keto reductase n=1 Tax=Paracholeplasma manati TaxID=591373 RepID=A0ABT2Y5A2_9MOLU|nr:aldo/keto reductase [Paracholeplasma manati]MCV2231906.1 aldo/keto reductase [Paracholeplasma manati]MDG0889154.1 aldo/keto reductase [Paracholeplasma manati]